jgi:hypothetical protein
MHRERYDLLHNDREFVAHLGLRVVSC